MDKKNILELMKQEKYLKRFEELYNKFLPNKGLCYFTSYYLYLFIRLVKPKKIVEMSPDRGWSSYLMLSAIDDEDYELDYFRSYDIERKIKQTLNKQLKKLSKNKYEFILGDAKKTLNINENIDLFFIDSDHSYSFAKFYEKFLHFANYIFVDDINPSIEYQDKFRTPNGSRYENKDSGGEPYIIYDYLNKIGYKRQGKNIFYDSKFFGNNEVGLYNSIWEKDNDNELIFFSLENQKFFNDIEGSYGSNKFLAANNSLLFKNK